MATAALMDIWNSLSKREEIEPPPAELTRTLNKSLWLIWLLWPLFRRHNRGVQYHRLAWKFHFMGLPRISASYFRKAIRFFKDQKDAFAQAQCLRDFGLHYERVFQSGDAKDHFSAAFDLFQQIGAIGEVNELLPRLEEASISLNEQTSQEFNTSPASLMYDFGQLQLEEFYKISSLIKPSDNPDALMRNMLKALLDTSNAQMACLLLEPSKTLPEFMALDFQGLTLKREQITVDLELIKKARAGRALESFNNVFSPDAGESVICSPLWVKDHYQGCIYLVNHKATHLFNPSSVKAVKILSSQISMLLDYSMRINQTHQMNKNLNHIVQSQTEDITKKNKSLDRAHKKLQSVHRLKLLLTETMVHDIKNYHSIIASNLKIIRKKSFPENQRSPEVEQALHSCDYISNLSSNLIDISKLEENKHPLQKIYFSRESLSALLETARVGPKRFSLHFEIPKDLYFEIYWDRYYLTRVFQSLADIIGSTNRSTEKEIESLTLSPLPKERTIYTPHSREINRVFCQKACRAHGGELYIDAQNIWILGLDPHFGLWTGVHV